MDTADLTILAFTADPWESACPMLRIVEPCRQSGMQLVQGAHWEADRLVVSLDAIPDVDVIVIQRDFPRWHESYREVYEKARAYGKPVIYELDDWLIRLPKEHPDYEHYRPARAAMLAAAIEADAVTASTATLCAYLGQYNPCTWLLPNCLDDALWLPTTEPPPNNRGQLVIGYMGGRSHTADIEMIAPALTNILKRYGSDVKMQFWGRSVPPPKLLALPNVVWDNNQYLDYAAFAVHFSQQKPDILLAPLQDNAFNRAKSVIKFLEYSNLGVPGIYSAIMPYTEIIDSENGILASTTREWEQALNVLIEDPQRRRKLGENAQRLVRTHWMLSRHAEKWVRCYTQAIQKGAIAPANKSLTAAPKSSSSSDPALQTEWTDYDLDVRPLLAELASAQSTIQGLTAQVMAHEASIAALTGQTMRQTEIVQSLEAQLQQMQRSITWRGTEPIRKAFAVLQQARERLAQAFLRPVTAAPSGRSVPAADSGASAADGTYVAVGAIQDHLAAPAQYQDLRFFWDEHRFASVSALPCSERVDIIVCIGRNTALAQHCIASVRQHTLPDAYQLHLVMHEQDVGALPEAAVGTARVVTHAMEIFNFSMANNLALRQCHGDVVLLNDDTEVTPGWLEKLKADSRGVALTGARTGPQCSGNPDMWGQGPAQTTWYPINMFCAYLPRRMRKVVGLLNEEFFYYGGEDVDYSCRALQNGFPLIISSAFVHHAGNQSFRGSKERLMQESDKILYERYGLRPPFNLSAIKPQVSVIMATRNRADLLPTAAHSILSGEYSEIELIIVDDSSTDGTWQVITELQRTDPRTIGVRLPRQSGAVNARHRGVEVACGQFIAFMDDDDKAWPNRIMAPLQYLLTHPQIDATYCGFDVVSETGRQRGKTQSFDRVTYLNRQFDIGLGLLLIRRSVVANVPFMSYYDRATDYDWVFRLVRQGYRIEYCPAVVLDYNRYGPAESHLAGNAEAIQQHKAIREREALMTELRR